MHRLALTVAGAAQALRKIAHLFPVYPRRRNVASAPEAAHYSRAGAAGAPIDPPHGAPYSRAMHAELDTLEAKIRQVAELCQTLRNENIALRQQLLTAQQDTKQLTTRLDAAKTRLQALLETLPEDV
jgi:cell division protein ZapB